LEVKSIIHLTDLHIGYADLADRFETIVDNMLFSMRPASRYVVVVTGDLVDKGTRPGNYETARLALDRLRTGGFDVLIVPGNHDYGSGFAEEKRFVPLFKEAFFGDSKLVYPKLDIIGGMAFIGLDTVAEEIEWHDRLFAEGELGEEQRIRLDDLLSDSAVLACRRRVVYMHHHPFDPHPLAQLRDSDHLGEVLMRHGSVDALLYGHNHAGKKANGRWGIPRCYDGGSATRKGGSAGEHRVMNLESDPRFDYGGDFHGNY
jgi:3',5'-cyclic AMP phosphodiesterase CpdA